MPATAQRCGGTCMMRPTLSVIAITFLCVVALLSAAPGDTSPVSGQQPSRAPDIYFAATPQPVVEAMLKLAGVKAGDVVYDLGCGDGRIVITAVKQFGAKRGVGIDLDPVRVKESIENAKKAGVSDRVEFKQGDVLKLESVADANVVTLYLLPSVNQKLAPMLRKTLKPGSRIVSHDFRMEPWEPDR